MRYCRNFGFYQLASGKLVPLNIISPRFQEPIDDVKWGLAVYAFWLATKSVSWGNMNLGVQVEIQQISAEHAYYALDIMLVL